MKSFFILIAGLFLSFNAFAMMEGMKPGLWQTTSSIKSKSGKVEAQFAQMQKEMNKLPPEQKKMMEQMMAKQGVQTTSARESILKVCVTKEQAESLEMAKYKSNECEQEIVSQTKKSVKVKFTCKNDTSGTGEFNLDGSTGFSASSTVKSKTPAGEDEEMYIKQKGKWLSADCGNIRPIDIRK